MPHLDEPSGVKTILVVDDEKAVLSITGALLIRGGFDILQALSGAEALEICRKNGSYIDLLLTDVMMPEMTGPQLVEKLLPLYPEMRMAYMSGCADFQSEKRRPLSYKWLVHKPFTPDALVAFVRDVLDEPRKREPGRQVPAGNLRKTGS
jgi:two-component system cell cycle sensor histidine kinase/response regulator CckA